MLNSNMAIKNCIFKILKKLQKKKKKKNQDKKKKKKKNILKT